MSDLIDYSTLLKFYLEENNLPFVVRRRNKSDGNCWYEAIADQIELHGLNLPSNHLFLRKVICNLLLTHPQKDVWVKNLFGGSEDKYSDFVQLHRRRGEWTDNRGLICTVTAHLLKRNIHIVGNANSAECVKYTKVESVPEANEYPPLTIGYIQNKHFQSIEPIGDSSNEPEYYDSGNIIAFAKKLKILYRPYYRGALNFFLKIQNYYFELNYAERI